MLRSTKLTEFALFIFALAWVLPNDGSCDERPNVLFIAIDDLNHWVTHLGRNEQARTPNIDRLAQMGVTFQHAYCAVPACEPSRCSLMGGRRPWTTGCYLNGHKWKGHQKLGEGLSAQFLKAGYHVAGAGKIYHGMQYYDEEWTEYMSNEGLSLNGPNVKKMDGFHEAHDHDLEDDDLLDYHSVDYCIERLSRKNDKPFFLACGLYKPHLPFVAPKKYSEEFPLDAIELPPFLENDLDDLPTAGIKMAKPGGDHAKFLRSGRWKAAIQSYLATCAYTDMNVGRLLDALETSPNRDNTIIVLWGDHGWSLGEKQHWRKFALWEEPTRMPFIWVAPGVTQAGTSCIRPVDLTTVYPTLCELADLPVPEFVEGKSIKTLLSNPNHEWKTPAITTHGFNNHAVRTEKWRYIRYANGDEELYDEANDPYEWKNLAMDPGYTGVKEELAAWLPTKQAPQPRKSN
ncbi:MAG: sulfatase [Aureliella sp.]